MSKDRGGALETGRQLDDWRDYQRMRQTGEAGTKVVPMIASPGSGDLGDGNNQPRVKPGITTETGGVDFDRKIGSKPNPSEPKYHYKKPIDEPDDKYVKRTSVMESQQDGLPKENFLAALLRMLRIDEEEKKEDTSLREVAQEDREGKTQSRIGGKFFNRFF
jgi:hypothetical protein